MQRFQGLAVLSGIVLVITLGLGGLERQRIKYSLSPVNPLDRDCGGVVCGHASVSAFAHALGTGAPSLKLPFAQIERRGATVVFHARKSAATQLFGIWLGLLILLLWCKTRREDEVVMPGGLALALGVLALVWGALALGERELVLDTAAGTVREVSSHPIMGTTLNATRTLATPRQVRLDGNVLKIKAASGVSVRLFDPPAHLDVQTHDTKCV